MIPQSIIHLQKNDMLNKGVKRCEANKKQPYITYVRLKSLFIKTHDSESRGQAGRTQQTSELFTGSTTMKFVNALNKPPLKLSLSYQGLSTF